MIVTLEQLLNERKKYNNNSNLSLDEKNNMIKVIQTLYEKISKEAENEELMRKY